MSGCLKIADGPMYILETMRPEDRQICLVLIPDDTYAGAERAEALVRRLRSAGTFVRVLQVHSEAVRVIAECGSPDVHTG